MNHISTDIYKNNLDHLLRKKRAYHSALNTPSYYTLYNNPNLFD